MTERLYYLDAYLSEFESDVTAREGDGRRIYLARTAFYPTSGGQPHDTGQLAGIPVVDVVDEDDRVAHVMAAPFEADHVAGRIDWPRRFDNMQQHTGQHLLSAVLAELFGFATTSVHFGADGSTLDLDAAAVTPEQVRAAEVKANEIVTDNRPVTIGFEDAAKASSLRRLSERTGLLRIVTIEGLDRSACGGTHVRATGEIGPILIGKVERVRKAVRLEFVCGARAVRRARADHDLLAGLGVTFSARSEELPALMEAQRADLKQASAARKELETELDALRARDLYDATGADASGLRWLVVRDGGTIERQRGLAQAAAALPRAVFIGTSLNPPGLIVAASEDSGKDASALLRAALSASGGRGGGTPRLAQGTAPAETLERAIAAMLGA